MQKSNSLILCFAENYEGEESRREEYDNTGQEDEGDDNRKRRSTDEYTDTYDYFLNEYLKQNHEEDEESLRARRAYQESWEFVTRSAGDDEEYDDLKELIKKEYYSLSKEDRGEFDEEEDVEVNKEDKTGDAFGFDSSVERNLSSGEGQQPNKTVPMEHQKQMDEIKHSDNDVAEVVKSANISDEVSQKLGVKVSETLGEDDPAEEERQNDAFYDNLTMSKLSKSHAQRKEEEELINNDKKIREYISEEKVNENRGIGIKDNERTVEDEEENAGINGNVGRTKLRESHEQVDEGHTKMHDDGLSQEQVSEQIANKTGDISVKVKERTTANVEHDGIDGNTSRKNILESHLKEDDANTQMHFGLIEEPFPAESVSDADNMFSLETEEKRMHERQNDALTHRDMGKEIGNFVKTKENRDFVNDTSTPEQHVKVNVTKTDEHAFKHGDSKTAVEKLKEVAYLRVEEKDDDDDVLVLVEEDNSDKISNYAFRDKDEASKASEAVDVETEKVKDGGGTRNAKGAHQQTESLGLHSMNDSQGKDNANQLENTVEQEGEDEKHSDHEIDDEGFLDFDDDPYDDDDDDDDDDDKSHFKYDVEAGRFKRAIWDNDDDEYEGDDSVGGMNEYAPDDEGNDPHSIEERSVDYDDFNKQFDDMVEEQKKKGNNEI